ncbi:hypothetical protein [Radicibacter daui]|uniref:hypothetical protein n=1 Tax=Radicibacter daui TaxID=3064829 RepID=UPI004046B529
MSEVRQLKTSFAAGELSPHLFGRGDLRAYENGARRLENVLIEPTGGIVRRPGLRYVATARGPGRLIEFQFNTAQTYLLVFTAGRVTVLREGAEIASLAAPWSAAQLAALGWTQSADTLLLCHPEVSPRVLTRHTADEGGWTLAPWAFAEEPATDPVAAATLMLVRQPYYGFGAPGVTLKPSATGGTLTLVASADVFRNGHDGLIFRLGGRQLRLVAIADSRQASAVALETLASTDATEDWEEPAFSPVRGWPASAAFHQGRLVIGGSRDLPNRLWFSKAGQLWNFDNGTGLDDEAIEAALLSDQVDAIRQIFPGRDLQIFTSGAEWVAAGDPLTPATIRLVRQTRIGSYSVSSLPPVNVDGATLFVGRSGRELREFLYTDAEAAYVASDLALLARPLVEAPVDIRFDAARRLVYLVRADGGVACLTLYREQQIAAWSRLVTQGFIRSVALVGEEATFLVERAGRFFIEVLDDALGSDAALSGANPAGAVRWSGLDHLDGRQVVIKADGAVLPPLPVRQGAITLENPVAALEAGLPFTHIVEPLPPGLLGDSLPAQSGLLRLVELVLRLAGTADLACDTGAGLAGVPLGARRLAAGARLDEPPPPFSGDVRLSALGWARDPMVPLWRIEGSAPLPFCLLSVTSKLKVTD